MEIIADLHTHTIASTHAYSTVTENAAEAERKNLAVMGLADHGFKSSDAPHIYYFINLHRVPRKLCNVTILRGVEANLDINGNLDMDEYPTIFDRLDYAIASMHASTMKQGCTAEEYTAAWLKAIENPRVDILGHMGDPRYPFDIDTVIKEAAKAGKIVEINNSSPETRKGCEPVCLKIIETCKKYGVHITLSSDAHFWNMVGKFDWAMSIVEKTAYPKELIINSSLENLEAYFNSRPGKKKISF